LNLISFRKIQPLFRFVITKVLRLITCLLAGYGYYQLSRLE
jgi:hypothetical protein